LQKGQERFHEQLNINLADWDHDFLIKKVVW